MWLHEQVLEALMRRHAVLPLRFGTLVPDAEMLRNRLAAMLPALGDDLRRLRGRVEFALRVTGVDAECLHTGDAAETSDAARTLSPGTRYLRERAERRRHRIAFEDTARCTERALRQHLDPTAESAAWGLAAERSTTLVASYLVPRRDARRSPRQSPTFARITRRSRSAAQVHGHPIRL